MHRPDDSLPEAAAFQISFVIPGPLSARLDALVNRAYEAGERTNRKELLAALILAAPEGEERLRRLLRRYRTAAVADAFLPGEDPATFLKPSRPRGPRRPPGRRTAPARRRRPASGDEGSTG
jgi:hypothetical protein